MNKEQLKKDIHTSLHSLVQQYETLLQHEAGISQIETDILLAHIRHLYEQVTLLGNHIHLNEQEAARQTAEVITRAFEKEKKIDYSLEPQVKDNGFKNEEPIRQEQIIASIQTEEPVQPPLIEKTEQLETVVMQQTKLKVKTASSLADTFHEKKTVLDTFSQQTASQNIAGSLQMKPIVDLTKSIPVNEKFLLINNLFGGNAAKYNECVNRLNKAASGDSALQVLSTEFAVHNNWNPSSQAYLLLIDMVKRRFSK